MAGHSKWHNIQHRKKGQDAKRGKIFTKLIRAITVAARQGGVDPSSNSALRLALDKANANNMPKDTVQRAVKRGGGDDDGVQMMEMRYEGYGPNGVAVMVDCLTDNKNRTVAEVRHAFSKCGGNLGATGSVAYLFNQVGMISFEPGCDEEKIMEAAIEAGADDVVSNDDGSVDVMTTPETFLDVKEGLAAVELITDNAEITQVASTEVTLDESQAEKMTKLTDMLEDLDDVQQVHSNADIPDEVWEKLQ